MYLYRYTQDRHSLIAFCHHLQGNIKGGKFQWQEVKRKDTKRQNTLQHESFVFFTHPTRKPFCQDTHSAYYLVMVDDRLCATSGYEGVNQPDDALHFRSFRFQKKVPTFQIHHWWAWSQQTGALWAFLLPQTLPWSSQHSHHNREVFGCCERRKAERMSGCEVGTHKCGRLNLPKIQWKKQNLLNKAKQKWKPFPRQDNSNQAWTETEP